MRKGVPCCPSPTPAQENSRPAALRRSRTKNGRPQSSTAREKLIVDYTESPVSVDFSDSMIAYRYADHSVYYTLSGTKLGSYPGAEGFFEDGLLLCRNAQTGRYSFVKEDGTAAFAAEYAAAGAFSDGLALVRSLSGAYLVIDTAGATKATLDTGADPAYYTVYGGDTSS